MALNPKMANMPKLDKDGYCMGELATITALDASDSDYGKEQFLFDFIATGTMKPINLKIWTGVTLSGERFTQGKIDDYNRLTRLIIQLGAVNETDLTTAYQAGKELPLDLDALVGTKVKFKTVKTAKSKGLSQIDLSTLEVLK